MPHPDDRKINRALLALLAVAFLLVYACAERIG